MTPLEREALDAMIAWGKAMAAYDEAFHASCPNGDASFIAPLSDDNYFAHSAIRRLACLLAKASR